MIRQSPKEICGKQPPPSGLVPACGLGRGHILEQSSTTPHTKINLTQIKDLNIRSETIELLNEKIKSKLLDIGTGDEFLGSTTRAKATKAKIS